MIDCNLQHIKQKTLKSLYDSGLGNMLFQIATAYALSKKYNNTYQISDIQEVNSLLKKFGGNHQDTIYRNIIIGKKKEDSIYIEEIVNLYDRNLVIKIKQSLKKNITINGYFQSYRYFNYCRDEVLKLFEMDNSSRQIIKKKYPILFTNEETVSLHIRNKWSDKLKYSEKYFKDALNKINKPNLKLLVFSDDIPNLKNKFLKNIDKIWVEGNLDYIDLWAMSLCKNNILSHSTLSWWGAYLNNNPNKIVIYSRDWINHIYKNKSPAFIKEFPNSHYPKNWIDINTKIFI